MSQTQVKVLVIEKGPFIITHEVTVDPTTRFEIDPTTEAYLLDEQRHLLTVSEIDNEQVTVAGTAQWGLIADEVREPISDEPFNNRFSPGPMMPGIVVTKITAGEKEIQLKPVSAK